MTWGTVTVAGYAFRETIDADDQPEGLHIVGQESHPPKLKAEVAAAHLNVVALRDAEIVPVVFSDKSDLTGFYEVTGSRSRLMRHAQGSVQTADWELSLRRVGTGRDIELESTIMLVGRTDALPGTQTPVFWHAPAIAATSYYTGATVPSGFVDRPGEDGIIRVYTGLPTQRPRWTIRAEDYMRGGARLALDTLLRIGRVAPPTAVWQVSNGLVRVTPGADGAITIACWDNGDYRSPRTLTFAAGGALTSNPELTVLRNQPEEVAVRLSYATAPGRTLVDLSLRRGSRFVTGLIAREASVAMSVTAPGSTMSAVTGGVRDSADDAEANRLLIGSSRNVTTAATSISVTGTRLDFFAGYEVGPAAAGDLYADLLGQYLGSAAEQVRVIKR